MTRRPAGVGPLLTPPPSLVALLSDWRSELTRIHPTAADV